MNWRSWPYWVKAGIACTIIALGTVKSAEGIFHFFSTWGKLCKLPYGSGQYPLCDLLRWIDDLGTPLILLRAFLFGSAIGFLYGKIRYREKNVSRPWPFSIKIFNVLALAVGIISILSFYHIIQNPSELFTLGEIAYRLNDHINPFNNFFFRDIVLFSFPPLVYILIGVILARVSAFLERRQKPVWLRGAIMSILIYLIFGILGILHATSSPSGFGLAGFEGILLATLPGILMVGWTATGVFAGIAVILLNILCYGLIGAVSSYLYGKFKNRNRSTGSPHLQG